MAKKPRKKTFRGRKTGPTVIFVGAHPDDIELGCAGTMRMFIERRYDVMCVYVTNGGSAARARESRKACKLLGVKDDDEHIVFGDFPDTRIPATHDTIMFLQNRYVEQSNGRDSLKCDVYAAFVHTAQDVHQDHRAVAECCLTAFRHVPRIYAYEAPSSIGAFNPTAFVDISNYHEEKRDALQCHESQLKLERYYLEYDAMMNLARFRGRQGGFELAEAFEVWKESIEPAHIR